jgi:hypothetical protein
VNLAQCDTVRNLIVQAESTSKPMLGHPKVEVRESMDWDHEQCIDVIVWAGAIGTSFIVDVFGECCDPDEGPGHPVRLVTVPDYVDTDSYRFSYEAA